ncbi:imm11 family protein [Numidum massiliense]|uniref:imm11 family protein n=1 Tax=Numidum massiliense TaxID=1522315 RepID=UPI0006D587EC|nr:DUF1629 domain-containing protein [Numidum massiliense]
MNYYKVLKDRSDVRDIICYCDDAHGFEQYELLEGRLIDNWPSKMLFYYNPDEGHRITDCLLNDLGWFVVSSKFKNLLDKMGGHNIQ